MFVEIVRKHLKHDRETGFKKAVDECMKHNILKEYLHRKSREVMNMLLAEYDYAIDIAVQRQEERQLALREGELKGLRETARKMKENGMNRETIVTITGLSVEEIGKL